MPKLIDELGNKHGHWSVVRRVATPGGQGGAWWLCRCDCGNEQEIAGARLREGKPKRCWACHVRGIHVPEDRQCRHAGCHNPSGRRRGYARITECWTCQRRALRNGRCRACTAPLYKRKPCACGHVVLPAWLVGAAERLVADRALPSKGPG